MTIDKFLSIWYDKNIEDWGGDTSLEYRNFQSNYRSVLKEICKDINMELHSFNKNHYEFTAIIKSNVTEKFYYISIVDVRIWKNEWANNILYRTMEHDKDWTGGDNRFCKLKDLATRLIDLDLQQYKKMEEKAMQIKKDSELGNDDIEYDLA